MKPTIIMESLRNSLGEYILVNVINGAGVIGTCDTTHAPHTTRRTLYAETHSLVNVFSTTGEESSNRQIWQSVSIDKCGKSLDMKLTEACENFFERSAPLGTAIQPVMELLTDGLYVVHADKTVPTDGAGNFFWNAYQVKHELNGSAPFNHIIGRERDFSPPFIVPTQNFAAYSEKAISASIKRVKRGKKIGGIAYHLTGMFSALLCGHTDAAAAVAYKRKFPCIIIEPLRDAAYATDENGNEHISFLTCPYAKLPIKQLSRGMIESFLLNRRFSMPDFREELCRKADKTINSKHAVRSLPDSIIHNAEQYPDAEMLASAFAITELTNEQLDLLISGETMCNGKYIISANYYESIVYACNYLQYKDKQRFITFAISLLNTPTLAPTYRYIAERMQYVIDVRIKDAFKNVLASDEPAYKPIKDIAQRYLEHFDDNMEQSVNSLITADDEAQSETESASKPKTLSSAISEARENVDEEKNDAANDNFSALKLGQAVKNSAPPPAAER
mgnify:CR=1 FL=1